MPILQQQVEGEWVSITHPVDKHTAFVQIHELAGANPDTTFRILPESAGMAMLHLEDGVRGGAIGRPFYVMCSCGQPFYGQDPNEAQMHHGEHLDAVMPDPNSDEYLADGTVRVWAARRAAERLGLYAGVLGEDDRDKIADAVTDLLWFAAIVGDEIESSAGEILASANFMFHDEKGDH